MTEWRPPDAPDGAADLQNRPADADIAADAGVAATIIDNRDGASVPPAGANDQAEGSEVHDEGAESTAGEVPESADGGLADQEQNTAEADRNGGEPTVAPESVPLPEADERAFMGEREEPVLAQTEAAYGDEQPVVPPAEEQGQEPVVQQTQDDMQNTLEVPQQKEVHSVQETVEHVQFMSEMEQPSGQQEELHAETYEEQNGQEATQDVVPIADAVARQADQEGYQAPDAVQVVEQNEEPVMEQQQATPVEDEGSSSTHNDTQIEQQDTEQMSEGVHAQDYIAQQNVEQVAEEPTAIQAEMQIVQQNTEQAHEESVTDHEETQGREQRVESVSEEPMPQDTVAAVPQSTEQMSEPVVAQTELPEVVGDQPVDSPVVQPVGEPHLVQEMEPITEETPSEPAATISNDVGEEMVVAQELIQAQTESTVTSDNVVEMTMTVQEPEAQQIVQDEQIPEQVATSETNEEQASINEAPVELSQVIPEQSEQHEEEEKPVSAPLVEQEHVEAERADDDELVAETTGAMQSQVNENEQVPTTAAEQQVESTRQEVTEPGQIAQESGVAEQGTTGEPPEPPEVSTAEVEPTPSTTVDNEEQTAKPPVDTQVTETTAADEQTASTAPSQHHDNVSSTNFQKEILVQRSLPDVLHRTTQSSFLPHTQTRTTVVKRTVVAKPQNEVQTRRFNAGQTTQTPPVQRPVQPTQPPTQVPAQTQTQIQQVQQISLQSPLAPLQPVQPIHASQQIQAAPRHVQSIATQQPMHHAAQHTTNIHTMQQGQIRQPHPYGPQQRIQPMPQAAYYANPPVAYQIVRAVQKPRLVSAAGLPNIPTRQQIQSLIRDIDIELDNWKKELLHLQHVQKRGIITVPKMSSKDPKLEVQDFRGFLISHAMVNDLEAFSRARGEKARSKWILHNVTHKYHHVAHLPLIRHPIQVQSEMMEPIYLVVRNWRSIVAEKAYSLAIEYLERRAIWDMACKAGVERTRQSHVLLDQWPPEFAKCVQKTNEAQILSHVGPDIPMYLDTIEATSYCFHDTNGFVSDPQKEHNAYRNRLKWTEAEVKTFLERYAQHPREFKRISTALPSKSVKDVIEFYNINRIKLNLKEIELASRKRGRKKMISEGMVRK